MDRYKQNYNCMSRINKTFSRTSLGETTTLLAEVEELSELELTDSAHSAGISSSGFCLLCTNVSGVILVGFIYKKKK